MQLREGEERNEVKTVKPPTGYRLLKNGDRPRKTDLNFSLSVSDSKDHWHVADIYDANQVGKKITDGNSMNWCRKLTRRPAPTPEACWRWLISREFTLASTMEGFRVTVWPSGTLPEWYQAKTPLAAVRKAMKAERKK